MCLKQTEMKPSTQAAPVIEIHARIITLREQKVILDTDLAAIYQVEVRALL
jgi:hypothetical protein